MTIGERLLRELLEHKVATGRSGDDDLVFPSRGGTHVVAQMRHADLTTTLRYYTHAQQHLRKAAADAFDAAVWGAGNAIPGRKQVAVRL